MFRIWAKIIKGDKIKKSLMYEGGDIYNHTDFFKYLSEICFGLDIPTPIVLDSHKQRFLSFNITRFKPCDFVESVGFSALVLENATEKDE